MRQAVVIAISFVSLGALISRCTTATTSQPAAATSSPAAIINTPTPSQLPNAAPVLERTVLPPVFTKQSIKDETSRAITVMPGMLSVAIVARPRAEVRSGPGGTYELQDLVLSQGTKVLVVEQSAVWRKIIVRDTWQRGWVHFRALSEPMVSSKPLTLEPDLFPTVMAMNVITAVSDYQTRKPLPVKIPKGTIFRSLRQESTSALVWISATNSVMWISKKDVH